MEPIKGKKPSKILIAGVAAVVLAVAVIMAGLSVSSGSREYKDHLEMAQKYLDELDYEQAVVELRMAIEIEPNNGEAYFALAEVYVAMGDYENALAVLEEGYAATGDEAFLEEKERIAGEYAKWQEQKAEQERIEQEQRVEEFYKKYAKVCDHEIYYRDYFVNGVFFLSYLTFEEREEAYGGLAEELEQYLVDLSEIEGLEESLYGDSEYGMCYVGVEDAFYFNRRTAYECLADIYLCMGKLEECLRVRTEWAEFYNRPDLVQDGNHGYDEYDKYDGYIDCEYDKYGRLTSRYYNEGRGKEIYIYEEPHAGATFSSIGDTEMRFEDDCIYDNDGRIIQHQRITIQNGNTRSIDNEEYTYTGNNSYVLTDTWIRPDGSMETNQLERFYDEYGKEIVK